MSLDPLTALLDVAKVALDKVLPDKMSEAEKESINSSFANQITKDTLTKNKDFRDFILDYEGRAKDVHPFIISLRSLIRPAFTCALCYWDFVYFSSSVSWEPEKIALLKSINLVVLFFWFGERAVSNSGILKLLTIKK